MNQALLVESDRQGIRFPANVDLVHQAGLRNGVQLLKC
jgi:hypothetical protein